MTGWNGQNELPALSYNQTVAAAYAAGFRGNALVDAVAISHRESGFVPNVYNGDVQTGDNSIGMMQINILGNNFPGIESILQKMGGFTQPLSRSEVGQELTDPIVNFRVAYAMSNGGADGFYSWGPYAGVSALRDTDIPSAQTAVNAFLAESPDQQAHDIANIHSISAATTTNTDSGGSGIPVIGGIVDAAGAVVDVVKGAGSGITDAATATFDLTKRAISILGWLTDWHNWAKMGIIAGGVILIGFGIRSAISKDTNVNISPMMLGEDAA